MKILSVKQGSTEWKQARCGIPTASEFCELVTPEFRQCTGKSPETYLLTKVAERIMGYPMEIPASFAMNQGTVLEDEAYPWFEGMFETEVQRVGFCTTDDGRVGASPDGLLGDDDGLELKCPLPHTHVKYLLGGVVPKEHVAQVQGCMFVTGRTKWTYVSYSRNFPKLVVRVERDPIAQAAIAKALETFLPALDAAEAKIRAMMPTQGRD